MVIYENVFWVFSSIRILLELKFWVGTNEGSSRQDVQRRQQITKLVEGISEKRE